MLGGRMKSGTDQERQSNYRERDATLHITSRSEPDYLQSGQQPVAASRVAAFAALAVAATATAISAITFGLIV